MSTVTTTYAYDKGQNRLSKVVSGGGPTLSSFTTCIIGNGSNGPGANQIVSATPSTGATTTYAYDGNGNRTGRTISGTTDVFSYDYENRLTSLDYLTGSSGTGMYTYTYDYRTRRVSRTEPSAGTTYIVFDSGTSIEEYTSTPSSPTVEYIRGFNYDGGVGGLEYSIRSGVPSFNFFDSRGDVTTKTSATGAVTWETAYEAFGNQTASSGTTPADRQRASTKEQDPTGFLNEGFRYRDLSTGTFLTRDPLGFKAGLNNYTYVHQNPWTRFDPEGLDDNESSKKNRDRTANILPSSRQILVRKESHDLAADAQKHGYPAPQTKASPTDIALGHIKDPGIKPASSSIRGAPGYSGKSVAIDVGLVQQSGGSITKPGQIKADMKAAVASGKLDPSRQASYNKAQSSEHEHLVNGPTGPNGSNNAMLALTSIGAAGAGIGLGISMRNMVDASRESSQTQSMGPVTKQAVVESSGWGSAMVGARVGAPFGAEGGPPGVMVTSLIGAALFGIAGSSAMREILSGSLSKGGMPGPTSTGQFIGQQY